MSVANSGAVGQPAPDAETALFGTLDMQNRVELLPKSCRALALAVAEGYTGRRELAKRTGLTVWQVQVRLARLHRMASN